MAENENGTVMLPPAKTQEAFVHIGFAKARLPRGRAFVLAILAGAFVALGASFMLMVRSDVSLSPTISLVWAVSRSAWPCFWCSLPVPSCSPVTASWLSARSMGGIRSFVCCVNGRLCTRATPWEPFGGRVAPRFGLCEMQGGAVGELACSVAASKASLSPVVAFSRGILCNVLVCLAVWMGSAGKTVCDKLAAAILPVVAFVVLGFEHSVANMFFLPLGLAIEALWGGSSVVVLGVASNLVFVTLGNIVGGVAIAAAYWFVYGREDRN